MLKLSKILLFIFCLLSDVFNIGAFDEVIIKIRSIVKGLYDISDDVDFYIKAYNNGEDMFLKYEVEVKKKFDGCLFDVPDERIMEIEVEFDRDFTIKDFYLRYCKYLEGYYNAKKEVSDKFTNVEDFQKLLLKYNSKYQFKEGYLRKNNDSTAILIRDNELVERVINEIKGNLMIVKLIAKEGELIEYKNRVYLFIESFGGKVLYYSVPLILKGDSERMVFVDIEPITGKLVSIQSLF